MPYRPALLWSGLHVMFNGVVALVQFEKAHSPLLKDLMLYLKELMKDYRTDVAGMCVCINFIMNNFYDVLCVL